MIQAPSTLPSLTPELCCDIICNAEIQVTFNSIKTCIVVKLESMVNRVRFSINYLKIQIDASIVDHISAGNRE